jgi:hypothetical protein
MYEFIGTSLQLQSIITVHNAWLYKTRSIPYWTTSVFSSTVADLVLIYESVTSTATALNDDCLTNDSVQSHIATEGQSVCLSWCRAPAGAHHQMFLLVWKLLSCPCGALSLTRGRVCHLSVIVGSISSSFVQLFTIWLLKPNRMYNLYKASVSQGSVQQTMPYF